MRDLLIQTAYIGASVLFILGLRGLTRPEKARRGMQQAAVGMLLAILGTLANSQILDYKWIGVGMAIGAVIGYPLGMWVPMTAMPQRIALALTFSSLAATLVGIAEYITHVHTVEGISHAKAAALAFDVLLGSITVGGTLVAAGKLQEWLPSRPMRFKGQHLVNGAWVAFTAGLATYVVIQPAAATVFSAMIAMALVFGVMFVLPIRGADMPVVVALLNSYAGLAACATGFAIDNTVLILAGALDGSSGFILSILMIKATNRSFSTVLFGAFSATGTAGRKSGDLQVRPISVEDAAIQLAHATQVIVLPGYGLAVAQAQHAVRELAELIEKRGCAVKYAIHPVAGRMPGHMHLLLAEANIPYDKLCDVAEINSEFERTDVVLVIGANDVVNPAARTDRSSPIYGMSILDADKARSIIVMKRSMAAGFAGIENELFYGPKTRMLFGDAKASLTALIDAVRNV